MLAPQGFDCTYVILTPSELEQLQSNSLGSLSIDPQLYTDVTGYILLSFVSGHILGRILKVLGRG
ncbi:hypothetical protein EA004_25165 [Vibrio anguillarum]|uniref:Uncharacterized protein n=4 Tax=Vibrio anguillarum TaxID=55601 RepID=A0ABD4KSU9_VIBAN|nr:hypothetical protein CEQ50_17565 [Vibrio anguillarum]MBF4248238.1 hypothetical protein [Vibrio anguillarum]MBF4254487.1 hypothetical protein [Vibrio anguillarum]MBF4274485.1 hypothetical protein [Vibrio anguillarum]MBF4284815.1 hypothetical protein [Vibrio anguillarum]